MAIPPELRWASGSSIWRTTISALTESSGQQPLTPAVVEEVNQALYVLDLWTAYIAGFLPADKTLNTGRITGNGDPVGGAAGLFITTDGTNNGITLSPFAGEEIAAQTSAGGSINVRVLGTGATGGTAFFGVLGGGGGVTPAGLRVDHDALSFQLEGGAALNTDNRRYAYRTAAPLDVSIDLNPIRYGYTIIQTGTFPTATSDCFFLGSPPAPYNSNAAVRDFVAVSGLPVVGSGDTAAVRYQFVSLAGTVTGTSGTKIQIVRYSLTTTTATVLLEIDGSTPSANNGGTPIDLDFTLYRYGVRVFHASLGAASVGDTIDNVVTLTLRKFAVE